MTGLIRTLSDRAEKHSRYRRTLRELRALPLDVALDLDLAGAEKDVARRAVYG